MSVKVPQPSVEYQCHHHCQCDFCQSRRSVNSKKFAISQRALSLRHAQSRTGCCCNCHDASNALTFAKEGGATTFDPRNPVPVNQTARNAALGRDGLGASSKAGMKPKTADEEARDAVAELDGLERLLIAEHKARVAAAREAGDYELARTTKTDRRPQPLPENYRSTMLQRGSEDGYEATADPANAQSTWGSSRIPMSIHDAYVNAHNCPVTPPLQCHASHRLQDTMNAVRVVTRDPINPENRIALKKVLYSHGMTTQPPTPRSEAGDSLHGGASGSSSQSGDQFKTLADVRTSAARPHGAGVVWMPHKKHTKDGSMTTSLPPGAAAAVSLR